ncbi:unnamed protein product [Ostreobium quekettii]|uniref:Condensin-2 complex subunit H2 n=1 Tax=Ostreobium quekettii TaxID=121088 RepID=A0A8S1J906_9CHLO|nr:unnamed protein product [Ostreobium quekettii]|eukprot:evm.model.scf_1356.5 EVM.evm.TU.scf_1356.5   scf_1356:31772-38408(+)
MVFRAPQGPEARYAHLLQPLRDLTDNWNIDLAGDLEEYLEELETLTFAFEGDNPKRMDFSEAALLIQGSACIYSKKVEYLSALALKAFEYIRSRSAAEKEKRAAGKKHRGAGGTQHDEEDFFNLGEAMQEGANIDLPSDYTNQRPSPIGPPAMLLALDDPGLKQQGDGDGANFRLNKCFVHSSGALLLDPRIADDYDDELQKIVHQIETFQFNHRSSGSVLTPPNVTRPGDDGLGGNILALDMEMPDWGAPEDHNSNAGAPQSPGICDEPSLHGSNGSPDAGSGAHTPPPLNPGQPAQNAASPSGSEYFDPYKPLDFQDCSALPIRPFKMRVPRKKRFSAEQAPDWVDNGLPPAPPRGLAFSEFSYALRKTALLKSKDSEREARPRGLLDLQAGSLAMDGRAAEEEFDVEVGTAGELDAWDGDTNPLGVGAESTSDGDGEDGFGPDAFGPQHGAQMWPGGGPDDLVNDGDGDQAGYWELCRRHIETRATAASAGELQTEIAARVADWRDRIEPVLEEEYSRQEFDLCQYEQAVLERLAVLSLVGGGDGTLKSTDDAVPFHNALSHSVHHEVPRRFLATLQLVNDGNVKISKWEEDGSQVVSLTLLKLGLRYGELQGGFAQLQVGDGTGENACSGQQADDQEMAVMPPAQKRARRRGGARKGSRH